MIAWKGYTKIGNIPHFKRKILQTSSGTEPRPACKLDES